MEVYINSWRYFGGFLVANDGRIMDWLTSRLVFSRRQCTSTVSTINFFLSKELHQQYLVQLSWKSSHDA